MLGCLGTILGLEEVYVGGRAVSVSIDYSKPHFEIPNQSKLYIVAAIKSVAKLISQARTGVLVKGVVEVDKKIAVLVSKDPIFSDVSIRRHLVVYEDH